MPAFEDVFRRYARFVWRVLPRLGVAEADVDDVAQEIFLGVYRNLHRFEGRCRLRTWIYGICRRRAIDYHRRVAVRPELWTGDAPEPLVDGAQERGLLASQERECVRHVLSRLDDEQRIVFELFDVEGISMNVVAESLQCPLQTAYSRLYAARRKLELALYRMRSQGQYV